MPQENAQPTQPGGQDPMQAISDLGASLQGLAQALQEQGAPKEVIAPLQASVTAFGDFMNAMQGKGQQPMAQADMNEAGNPNAKPANY